VKPTTSAIRSKPSGNTKNNRITRPPSSNQKNKVEEHPRKVKSSLNKMNSISIEPISDAHAKHYVSKTCPSLTKPTEKLVVVTLMNKDKKVRFAEPVTSSSNIRKQTDSLRTKILTSLC
ncbi:hypothetical protein Tco_0357797, partial [Tanacetum coccineum]